MAPTTTFGERFGYAKWLYHLRKGYQPGHAEIGDAVGREGQAVTHWADREAPPPDYRDGKPLHAPLAEFLQVDKAWLIDGAGEPPLPELWERWIERARSGQHTKPPKSTPAMGSPKRAASAKKRGRRRASGG